MSEPIGGYFELEVTGGHLPHRDAVLLNSGRNSFEYILRAVRPRRVLMPTFTCPAMYATLRRLSLPFTRYPVTERLEPATPPAVGPDELLVYTNYFGLKDAYARSLAARYGEALVLDCSQALLCPPLDRGHTFYSPRKFVGVPDGGMLVTSAAAADDLPVDTSFDRTSHLLKRIDSGPAAGYADFRAHEERLAGRPMRRMSPLTRRLLGGVDFAAMRQRRQTNYRWLHERLGPYNAFAVADADPACPLAYPFMADRPGLRRELIAAGVFVPTFWPDLLAEFSPADLEHRLAEHLLPLPIDQRYTPADLTRIVEVVRACRHPAAAGVRRGDVGSLAQRSGGLASYRLPAVP